MRLSLPFSFSSPRTPLPHSSTTVSLVVRHVLTNLQIKCYIFTPYPILLMCSNSNIHIFILFSCWSNIYFHVVLFLFFFIFIDVHLKFRINIIYRQFLPLCVIFCPKKSSTRINFKRY